MVGEVSRKNHEAQCMVNMKYSSELGDRYMKKQLDTGATCSGMSCDNLV